MNEAQKNSVRNLQYLYTTVIGLGLSLAIYNLIDTTRVYIPLKLEFLPFFFTFLITLIPFYHGALRHLDITYIEQGGKQVRNGALMIDFLALFIEGCLLLILALIVVKPMFFVWGLVVLLAFDTLWAFTAYLGFSQDLKLKAEPRWAIINFITAIGLSILLIFVPPCLDILDSKLVVLIPLVALIRTVIDYIWCWNYYYPSS